MFKNTARDLKKIWKIIHDEGVLQHFRNSKIHWKLIIEKAAWWGGFWERLINPVKNASRKTLKRNSLTFEELRTVLTEVEATVHSRPQSHSVDDLNNDIFTPAQFLVGKSLTSHSLQGIYLKLQALHTKNCLRGEGFERCCYIGFGRDGRESIFSNCALPAT